MSPRTKQQYSQIKDERREQILSAALKVFAKRGLAASKISDIAEEASLSIGLTYHYFKSKEDVFIELVTRAVDKTAEVLKKINEMPMEPLDKIRTIADKVLESIYESEDFAFYFLLLIQAYVSDANPEEARERIMRNYIHDEIMSEIIREGQEKGSIRDGNIHDYVSLFWAAIQGLALYKISMGQRYKISNTNLLMRMFTI